LKDVVFVFFHIVFSFLRAKLQIFFVFRVFLLTLHRKNNKNEDITMGIHRLR